MTEAELDEIMTLRWPVIVRRVLASENDAWLKGFVLSIARNGKRRSWHPSTKQEQIMRRLIAEQHSPTAITDVFEVIER
ncbi:hypothetical protein KM176_17320 [Pseudooceanicola sp. CBS1P-1]|uniref:Uncharacterized protein n=1 Tax=Pseudooceanicola albus TaxID=2692189 RepID=A0A6L7G4B8_9RHOB|nr:MULTISPECIES: hypothetical protein [Pseudooceanicola]MBT9385635.1 hypothetical protein [Pseudooceanicola endophyticus]MXN18955.1 hypothetical protein [Pseudooceanicola albus]